MIKRQSNQGGEGSFLLPPPITFGCSLKFIETKVVLTHGMMIDEKGVTHPAGPAFVIEIVQLEESGVILEVPAKLCAQNEKVNLGIVCQTGVETFSGEFSAKIKKVHMEAKSTRESIEIDFIKFDQEVWDKICEKMKQRQGAVNRILEAMQE